MHYWRLVPIAVQSATWNCLNKKYIEINTIFDDFPLNDKFQSTKSAPLRTLYN
jgi:hypothetical protein